MTPRLVPRLRRVAAGLLLLASLGQALPAARADDAPPTPDAAREPAAAGPASIFLPLVSRESGALPANLLANGDFESGSLAGWEAGGATVSTVYAHSGQASARLANQFMRTTISTMPGQAYKATAWVRIVSESGDDWGGFRLAAYGPDWEVLAEVGPLLQSQRGAEWFKIALSFTAAAATTPIEIGYFGGPGRQMVAHVDDVTAFVKGANRPPVLSAALTPALSGLPGTQTFNLVADDADGAVARILWDFGDGARAFAASGARGVAVPGHYTATVSVTDDDGALVTRAIPWTAAQAGFPALIVSAPAAAETTVSTPDLAVSGSAGGAAGVIVSTDRGFVGAANGGAAWDIRVPLQPGWNRLLVQARGADGRVVTQERRVRYAPPGELAFGQVQHAATVERWQPLEITFNLENSAATHPQFPYGAAMPPGLSRIDGVTVDALFTPDNWATVYRRPAFLYQPYERALKDGQEWLYLTGRPVWKVRFAPPSTGPWRFRLEAVEARGAARSAERTFTVNAAAAGNHGPVRVARNDARYFEFADGALFLGNGHGVGYDSARFSYDAVDQFNAIGAGNQQFFRWWLSGEGRLWGSAWQAWRSRTLTGDGYIPATGLTLERAYGDGMAALRLDADNPIMFQGFDTGRPALIPGRAYRLVVRWRTEAVTGPRQAGQPHGVVVKFTGWPEPGETGALPALVPHVNGDTPWHVAYADFVAGAHFAENIALILENATGGAAYVDAVALYERLEGGALGPQLLRHPAFNSHLAFDPVQSAGVDAILAEANARGFYYKLVISEKNEYLLNRLAPDGLPDPLGGHFDGADGAPARWLHEAYWRYLFARFGAYRSVHSWELVNEAAPAPGAHFQLAAALARRAAADGNPHPATTSTWATLAEAAWKDPASAALGYADFHAYVRATGWLEPRDQLADDSARFFNEYDLAARAAGFGKPVVWGEMGIDGAGDEEPRLAADLNGVWLHKLTWARTGPGGVYPLYWYTDNLFDKALHPIYGAWNRFMAGLPLNNGRYQDAAATASNAGLRVLGQKDLTAGWAHIWIDNRAHTWRSVVDGRTVAPVSGTVRVALGRANTRYSVAWYDTATGRVSRTQTLTADSSGVLALTVTNLRTDTAARITRK